MGGKATPNPVTYYPIAYPIYSILSGEDIYLSMYIIINVMIIIIIHSVIRLFES